MLGCYRPHGSRFSQPTGWPGKIVGREVVLVENDPALVVNMFLLAVGFAYADGFIDTDSLNAMVSSSGMVEKHTTSLGDDMIEFFGIEKM